MKYIWYAGTVCSNITIQIPESESQYDWYTAYSNDPQIYFDFNQINGLDIAACEIEIAIKTEQCPTISQLFLPDIVTEGFTEERSVMQSCITDGNFFKILFVIPKAFRGWYHSFRFDPLSSSGSFSIRNIIIFSQQEYLELKNQYLEFNSNLWSCKWIEGGAAFGESLLSLCCIYHHGRRGAPVVCLYQGSIPFPQEKLLNAREQTKLALQIDRYDSSCKNCPNLIQQNWQKEKYLIDIISIGNSMLCNLRCTYCFTLTRCQEQGYSILPVFSELFRTDQLSPQVTIGWGGGEPTISKDFEKLLFLLLQYNPTIHLYTNCVKKSNVLIEAVKQAKIDTLICSIDSGSPQNYFDIRQRNFYEQVWNNLTELNNTAKETLNYYNKPQIVPKYIFLKNNFSYSEVNGFINEVKKRNFDLIMISYDWRNQYVSEEIADSIVMLLRLACEKNVKIFMDPDKFNLHDLIIISKKLVNSVYKTPLIDTANLNFYQQLMDLLESISKNIK